MKIAVVLGPRPEIIKMAPIIKTCAKENLIYNVIHTEQHYDNVLSQQFVEDLQLRKPDYLLNVGSGTHGAQTGKALINLEKIMIETKPDNLP